MIMIDMEMPNECHECPFQLRFKNGEADDWYERRCIIANRIIEYPKPNWCPLAEIVHCKDCKYCNHTGCAEGFGWCECQDTATYDHGTRDEFCCANGEKRDETC